MSSVSYNIDQTLDQFLKERHRVQEDQLGEIQRVHAIEGGGWAGHFVDAGIVTENELLQLILTETGLPYIPLLQVNASDDLVNEFTSEFLQTFECYPIERLGPVLTMATPNPFQPELVRSRASRTDEVRLFVCRVSEWRERMRQMMEKDQKQKQEEKQRQKQKQKQKQK